MRGSRVLGPAVAPSGAGAKPPGDGNPMKTAELPMQARGPRSPGDDSRPARERRAQPGPGAGFNSTETHRRAVIDRTMQDTVRLIAVGLVPIAGLLSVANWLFLSEPERTLLTVLCALTGLFMAGFVWATRRRPIPPRHVHWVAFALLTPVYAIGTLRWAMSGELHQTTSLALVTVATGSVALSTPWAVFGMIVVTACWLGAAFSQPFNPDIAIVAAFQVVAMLVGSMIHVLRVGAHNRIGDLMAEAEDRNFLLSQQARVDELTGVLNRRALMAALDRKIERSQPPGSRMAVIMIDLDNFKRINDTWGHPAGDAALQEFARRVQRTLRVTDIFGRYGGEEFACILPETDVGRAKQAAERIREEIAAQPFRLGEHEVTVTASLGLTMMRSGMRVTSLMLLESADRALLWAKAQGKNRVMVAEEMEDTIASSRSGASR